MQTKICTTCHIELPLEAFAKEAKGKFGVTSKCRKCLTARSKEWKKNNQEREKENRKGWNRENKERHRDATYKWREAHKREYLDKVSEYQKAKKVSDPLFKFMSNIRSLVYNHMFVLRGYTKRSKTATLLDCDFQTFFDYIQSLFTPKMNWENHGEVWTLDHICPCAQAQNEEELIKLQHYSNWAPSTDNYSKSDKKTPEGEIKCMELLGREWIDR